MQSLKRLFALVFAITIAIRPSSSVPASSPDGLSAPTEVPVAADGAIDKFKRNVNLRAGRRSEEPPLTSDANRFLTDPAPVKDTPPNVPVSSPDKVGSGENKGSIGGATNSNSLDKSSAPTNSNPSEGAQSVAAASQAGTGPSDPASSDKKDPSNPQDTQALNANQIPSSANPVASPNSSDKSTPAPAHT